MQVCNIYWQFAALFAIVVGASDESLEGSECGADVQGTDDYVDLLQSRTLVGSSEESRVYSTDEATDEEVFSDPFDEVPAEQMVRDAAGVSHPKGMPDSWSYTQKETETTEVWDDDALKRALTSVQCKSSEHNRSCAFENLYFNQEDGGFFVFSLADTEHPDFNSVMLFEKWYAKGAIRRRNFDSLESLREFLQVHQPVVKAGLSLLYDTMFHFNIAHALWDGLYPAFLALCEFGRHDDSFRSVVNLRGGGEYQGRQKGEHFSEGVLKKFGGGELMSYEQLKGSGWHVFADIIAGSGHKGQRSINRQYALPGGRSLDGARRFRDRMYTSHGLPVPSARASSAFPLRGIIIDNKRFNSQEVALLKNIAKTSSSTSKAQLEYINYGSAPFAGNFTRQLQLIGSVGLHISGPGTAQGYGPFLPDGSVHVNLGDRRGQTVGKGTQPDDHRRVSFMEEVWSEGVPYIRALYYDPLLQHPRNYTEPEVRSLLQHAIDLARSNFTVPVKAGANLSPIGHVFKEYCASSAALCNSLLSWMNSYKISGMSDFAGVPDAPWCSSDGAWAEAVVFEMGGWSEAGVKVGNSTVHCLLDRKVMRQVRARHLGW